MKKGMEYLRRKRAKGRDYWYFDTGRKENGKRVLTRLPDRSDLAAFGGAYARALAARTMRSDRKAYISVDELIRRYEKSPEFRALSENSKRSYSRYLATANKLLRDGRGDSPPATSIEPRDVVKLRETLSETPGAANQVVRSLGALYNWASNPAQGYAQSNPTAKVTLFRGGEHDPWPESLLEEALSDPLVQLPVALLYFTGQRIGDVVRMQWGDFDRILNEIFVLTEKTKTRLRLPVAAELGALLRAAERPSTAIATNGDGRPWTTDALRQKLKAWAKARGYQVVPHGLRKNAVNALFEAGCTGAEVAAITGQSLRMLEHYGKGRSQPRIGRAAILKLEDARQRRNGSGK